ncbi:MAG: DoxX family protein [Robiginitomaculum sp.]|nr:DoxX family protein [Robiginitomaculum sp.]
MPSKVPTIYVTAGRILLALYFLLPGVAKLLKPASQVTMMEHHNIPAALPLLYVAGATQVIGALLLIANRYVRFAALGFVLYIIVINALMHDFWNFTGTEAAHEIQNFIKNLGILAGLLVLAGFSPKRKLNIKSLQHSDGAHKT